MGIFWISTVAFVVLMALMVWFMIAYRRRPGPARVIPRSASHNTPLELFWTVVPTIFLVWMFFAGFWGFADAMVVPGDAIELFVKGRKWSWEVSYPNGATTGLLMTKDPKSDGFTPFAQSQKPLADAGRLGRDDVPVIVIPVNTNVKLRLVSEDVLHAFWIPDFRTKIDVIPNRYTNIWFRADENQIGDHWVFCAEYCGDNHSEMLAVLRVVPHNDYEATIAKWATPENPVEWGKLIWTNTCKSCHTSDGSKGTGPTWKDLFGKTETLRGGQQQLVDENYVRESILTPSFKIVEGYKNEMQSFQGILNNDQINAIILYMKSISQHAPQPPAGETPAGETPGGAGGGAGGGTDGQKPPTGGGQ
jgi:cytochrome c oxidase subunit 2